MIPKNISPGWCSDTIKYTMNKVFAYLHIKNIFIKKLNKHFSENNRLISMEMVYLEKEKKWRKNYFFASKCLHIYLIVPESRCHFLDIYAEILTYYILKVCYSKGWLAYFSIRNLSLLLFYYGGKLLKKCFFDWKTLKSFQR